jgi:anti-anti-sigma factor
LAHPKEERWLERALPRSPHLPARQRNQESEMSIRIEQDNGVTKVFVERNLTIYSAREMKKHLLDLLPVNETIDINLEGVGEIDTAGFQVLLLFKREAERLNKRLILSKTNTIVGEIINLMETDGHFSAEQRVPPFTDAMARLP